MKISNRLQYCAALVCAAALITPPLAAHTKKGDKLLKLGEAAEARKDYDAALNYYSQALETDPKEPAYLLSEQNVRGKAAAAHLSQGKKLQQQQKLDEALVEFQKAFLAQPSAEISLQEIQQTSQMIKDRARAPAGTPILTPAEKARQDVESRINSLEGPPTLRPINNAITRLQMNNQPTHVLYESVGKLAGINVLFDPAGIETTVKNFNLDLNNVTLDEALSYIALMTHTFWKPISKNAIFVMQDTQPKRQEYQDEVVRVFYIHNTTAPTELPEIFNAVRIGAKLSAVGAFQVLSQNAIVARGTPDTIALVEKLVHDLDRPKSEIVVDVIVMEVNRDKSTTLGAAIAGLTGGLNTPIQFTPRNPVLFGNSSTNTNNTTNTNTNTNNTNTNTNTNNTTNPTGGVSGIGGLNNTTGSTTTPNYISLAKVGHVASSDFSVSLPGALIQALLTDNSTRILERPQVRVTDNGKASLKIGSRIPYVSGSLNSAVATPGSIPYATTQFQQVDVGTQIDLEPHVNGPDDISMHIKVEISNVVETENIGGVQQPVIGQKITDANIRLKDGEVSVLGGLYNDENDNSISGIPGVTNIPFLGYLFGSKTKTHNRDEVLIALIPHIVRAPDVSASSEEGVLAGTESVVRVEHKPDGTQAPPLPGPVPPAANPQPVGRPPDIPKP